MVTRRVGLAKKTIKVRLPYYILTACLILYQVRICGINGSFRYH